MTAVLPLLFYAASCPASAAAPGTAGLSEVARVPTAEAMRLNNEGKQLYRQERWEGARAKYAAALAADPEMFAAQLNLACGLSRQGRYEEAAQEAARLIRRSFVPWNREVIEAADLGILQTQPSYQAIQAAQAEAAKAWAAEVQDGVFFVARTRPPVNLAGEGTLALALNQEIFAWIPRAGRYFQLSAEDGRVLAFAVSPDRRHVAYLLAGRVVRQPGQSALLRGLSLRVLEIPTMALGPKISLPTDLRQVQLWYSWTAELGITGISGEAKGYKLVDQVLGETASAAPPKGARTVVLSDSGVAAGSRRIDRPGCAFSLADAQDEEGTWRIQVSRPHGKPFFLDTRYGAGLSGLPFPEKRPRPAGEGKK